MQPFMYWVGMNPDPQLPPSELAEIDRFYSATHVAEVVASNPGFVRATRYELLDPDGRGEPVAAPRWLAIYDVDGEAGVRAHAERTDPPAYSPWPGGRLRANILWRMSWRQIADCGTSDALPDSIFVVGMNVPAETDAAGLAEFNDFYTNVHLPEVLAAGGYSCARRFELFRDLQGGSPRFLATYEGDQEATQHGRQRLSQARFSPGPPVWQKHDTRWRLVYRRRA
jgi:hypothetical protein